jgi:hypothetical protein
MIANKPDKENRPAGSVGGISGGRTSHTPFANDFMFDVNALGEEVLPDIHKHLVRIRCSLLKKVEVEVHIVARGLSYLCRSRDRKDTYRELNARNT